MSVLHRPLSSILLNISDEITARLIWTKLGRNVPWEILIKNLKEFDSKSLAAHGNQMDFLCNSVKVASPGTVGQILGNHMEFSMKFFKSLLWNNCSDSEKNSQGYSLGDPFQKLRNFDLSRNMALVNGGYLHYMDRKKFLKIYLKPLVRF